MQIYDVHLARAHDAKLGKYHSSFVLRCLRLLNHKSATDYTTVSYRDALEVESCETLYESEHCRI